MARRKLATFSTHKDRPLSQLRRVFHAYERDHLRCSEAFIARGQGHFRSDDVRELARSGDPLAQEKSALHDESEALRAILSHRGLSVSNMYR
jgi:hypothetical protein